MTMKIKGKDMDSSKASYALFIVAAAAAIILSVRTGVAVFDAGSTSLKGVELRCVINPGIGSNLPCLTIGHNYELLQKYAEHQKDSIVSIILAEPGSDYLDSLKKGAVEIVVMPWCDTLQEDSISFSRPIEGNIVWAMASRYKRGVAETNSWIGKHTTTEEYSGRRDLFIYRYDPLAGSAVTGKAEALSPYDALFKKYSKELGWDWRLLAAIAYHESKFHIEAVSHKGAQGLMQVRPGTAAQFGITDTLDPEQNIKAGVAFLQRLQALFRPGSANEAESVKISLAAYNAGEGRIRDCMNLAAYHGLEAGYWDNIVSVIPQMRDSSIFDTDAVRYGMFHGKETIRYVGKVIDLYEDFKTVYPEMQQAIEP